MALTEAQIKYIRKKVRLGMEDIKGHITEEGIQQIEQFWIDYYEEYEPEIGQELSDEDN